MTKAMEKASAELIATKAEMEAAVQNFTAATYRGDAARLRIATEAAHAALQSHLDAIGSAWAVAKRDSR